MENHDTLIGELVTQENKNEVEMEISSIEIPEPIFSKNPKRFNSGEELYDFLGEIQANIIKIIDGSSNKIR